MEHSIKVTYNSKTRTFTYDEGQTLYAKSVYVDNFEVNADLTQNQTMYVCFENKETGIKTKNVALVKNEKIYSCKIPSKILTTGIIDASVSIYEPIATAEGQTKYSCITNQTITFNCDVSDTGNGIEGVEFTESESLVNSLVNATNNSTDLANNIKKNYVKTTKTINSLAVGDTLFKEDEIFFKIDQTQLLFYFLKKPIWTHIYLVNKETNEGFRFACYIKHLSGDTTNGKYVIDIQVHYVEENNEKFILENSILVNVSYGIPSVGTGQKSFQFTNTIKDISNLYIYYENSLEEDNKGEGFIGGITAEKVGEVQDTLLNHKDGVETPINGYVKVKDDKFVKVVDNVEKLLPINEETDKKLDELKDKINSSHTVNISKFALNQSTNTWYTDSEIKGVTPSEGNGARYVVKTNDGLYYYTYRDIVENVGFVKGNSDFYETTISGKKGYTSNTESSVREGSPLRLDKNVKDLSSVSFDIYMSGLGSTNKYYPEIMFVANEGTRRIIGLQFTCWLTAFQLKLLRFGKDTIKIESSLPYNQTDFTFNANVSITMNNGILTVLLKNDTYLKNGKTYSINLKDLLPTEYDENGSNVFDLELYDFSDLENIYFGLRQDTTPPTNWGFSNVVFKKKYWEQGYKIQGSTLYVNLEDNTLYRYTNDTNTKPYPNFVKLSSGTTSGGATIENLSKVAETGNYNDLKNKPTIPTNTSQLTNNSGFVNETFVKQELAKLVNSAPTTLDTLGEIASALKNNANIVDTLNQAIGNKADKTTVDALRSEINSIKAQIGNINTILATINNELRNI